MKDDEEVLAPVPDGVSVDPPGADEGEVAVTDAGAAAAPDPDYTPAVGSVLISPEQDGAYDVERDVAP